MRNPLLILTMLLIVCPGCRKRIAVDTYPPGTLHVRYAAATELTDCLVASVSMCANYLLQTDRYTPPRIRQEMQAQSLDPSRVGDMQTWLADKGLTMTPVKGSLEADPPLGVAWWVQSRGHPVICVVNKYGTNADYNHAVVVIGVELAADGRVDALHVLDPASPKRLERWDRETMETHWNATDRVMLPMFVTPETPIG